MAIMPTANMASIMIRVWGAQLTLLPWEDINGRQLRVLGIVRDLCNFTLGRRLKTENFSCTPLARTKSTDWFVHVNTRPVRLPMAFSFDHLPCHPRGSYVSAEE